MPRRNVIIESGKDLTKMLRTGWTVIIADPSISFAAFLVAINPTWTQADWEDGYTILTELGYFSGSENWTRQKTWVTDKTIEQGRSILKIIRGSGTVSNTLLLRQLGAMIKVLRDEKNQIQDEITNAFEPFLIAVPIGVDQRVVGVVTQHQAKQRQSRDNLLIQIADLQKRIDELT